MKKVGILGGTFDPPHYGHLLIANEVLSALKLDKIWFMPNHEPPHKKKPESVKDEDRLRMLELAIEGNSAFRVQPIELERNGPSYTVDTMKILNAEYSDHQFFFIIGADMIEYLPKWHDIDILVNLVQFVGVERPSYSHQTDYPVLYVDVPAIDVSSSMIRDRVKKGKSVRYLLPDPVIDYIEEKHLYGTSKSFRHS
ncbi:nicotinate-nucleotide adenylyltransferase [Neobacillus bataviensis]|uniref:Probable nicotinate-nucleotide adenylyltransferase n=1 Tax=Neobacillus bataviensis TaxID=220685 RepID=A0A561DGE9_9BACI|nr:MULTISPECIES: nicotinate-nucleotide adenylyltransferase [Bacillaceae]PFO03643.1 nicotinic acid mononucleotide adenylyltransferase [Bacillus sp. AFS076308]PGV54374.1 nicotinic acid mononucleotide adenylyltransferase [Bacillus sp. AFS037270]TWE02464.1 nicotinate-nucleotide adenylyltransferase [Neobacillus bataviensis]